MADDVEQLANSDNQEYDAGNEKHVNTKKTKAGRRNVRLEAECKALMSRPVGRELLRQILDWCLYGQDLFDRETNYAYARIGAQNVGLKLQALMLKSDAQQFVEVITEKFDV